MKYLDERIFDNMDEESANKLWNMNATAYKKAHSAVEDKLPSLFKKEYYNVYFHDYHIVSIIPVIIKNYHYNIELILQHHDSFFKITYKNVTMFKCNISLDESLAMVQLLQSEILPGDDNCISHEFTVSGTDYSFVHIICKKICFAKIRKEEKNDQAE